MIKKTDPDIIAGYLEDSSNLAGGHADGIYVPENEDEINEALAECVAKKTPLTVSAGQTGTTGGCIPFGGWILTTQKLNKVINIDKEQKFAVVQPGVTLDELEKPSGRPASSIRRTRRKNRQPWAVMSRPMLPAAAVSASAPHAIGSNA
jgi:hypothetical protein